MKEIGNTRKNRGLLLLLAVCYYRRAVKARPPLRQQPKPAPVWRGRT